MAQGTIGWPMYPERCPSTLRFTSKRYPHQWIEPKWDTVWFPDAFEDTMAQLLRAVEACYKSIAEKRTVALSEMLLPTD